MPDNIFSKFHDYWNSLRSEKLSQSKRSDDAITKYNGSQSIIVVSAIPNGIKTSPSWPTNYWIQNVNEDSQIMTNVNKIRTTVLAVGYIQEMYITGK